MANLNYDGDIVNSSVQNMSNITEKFVNLSSAMQNATNKIVSARGFNEYIGGISTDSFSGQVNECETASNTIINQIRQSQINILSYSEDKDEIKKFLSTLDRLDYKELDLTAIEDYISLRDKAKNVFSGLLGDVGAFFLGLGEGVVDFFETGADLIVTGGTSLAGIFTSLYDKAHGTNYTDKMWNWSRSFVATKHSENLFNSIYANTATGRFIKNNAYGFDKVRGVGKGLGYTAGVVALTAVTGGAATGAFAGGISAASLAGTVSAGGLAATAGTLGLSTGVEEAWGQGATTGKGALYGVANAGWEAAQWYAGGKIAGIGGTGPGSSIASGLFKSGAATRIGLDTATAASEGFARPAMNMIYKDYGDGSFIDKYKEAFKESGGWGNVGQCAAIGLFGSVIGEVSNARKLLKDNKKPDVDVEGDTTPLLPGSGDSEIPRLSGEVIGNKKLLTTADEGAEKVFASTVDDGVQKRLTGSTLGETPLLTTSEQSITKLTDNEYVIKSLPSSEKVAIPSSGTKQQALAAEYVDNLSTMIENKHSIEQFFEQRGETIFRNDNRISAGEMFGDPRGEMFSIIDRVGKNTGIKETYLNKVNNYISETSFKPLDSINMKVCELKIKEIFKTAGLDDAAQEELWSIYKHKIKTSTSNNASEIFASLKKYMEPEELSRIEKELASTSSYSRKMIENATASQKDAAYVYTNNGYEEINSLLTDDVKNYYKKHYEANGKTTQDMLDSVYNDALGNNINAPNASVDLQELVRNNRIQENIVVHRSVADFNGLRKVKQLVPGTVFENKGFTSTTASLEDFANILDVKTTNNIRLDILIPGGSEAAYIEPLSGIPGYFQNEVLINPNSKLTIIEPAFQEKVGKRTVTVVKCILT